MNDKRSETILNVLAFDTSAQACSVALQHGESIHALHDTTPMQQAARLLPMIQQLLTAASLTLDQLDFIAFGQGPGSFTGCRIAACTAQALAYAVNKPIVAVSSLAVLAQTAYTVYLAQPHSHLHLYQQFLLALDAHGGHIYWAVYTINNQKRVQLLGQEEIKEPHMLTLPASLPFDAQTCCALGDAWDKYQDIFINQLRFTPDCINSKQIPDARALLALAIEKFVAGECLSPHNALPNYLR